MPQFLVSTPGGTVTIYAPRPGQFDESRATALLGNDYRLGSDTEGKGLRKKHPNVFGWGAEGLRLVQFGTKSSAVVLNPRDPAQRAFIIDTLNKPFVFVAHNARHEAISLYATLGVDISEKLYDTYLLSLLIAPGANVQGVHGLKPLSSQYLDERLNEAQGRLHNRFSAIYPAQVSDEYKFSPDGKKLKHDESVQLYGWDNIPVDDPAYVEYAGLDAVYVRRLVEELIKACKTKRVYSPIMREMRLARQSYRMAMKGWRVDGAFATSLLDDYGRRHYAAKDAFAKRYGFPTGSPKKVPWAQKHGARIQAHTKSGGLSLAGAEVDRLLGAHPEGELHDFLSLLHDAAETQNVTQFVNGLQLFTAPDGWVHPQFNTLHAVSGRMSAVDPAVQTVSWRNPARGCFVPDNEDEVLVSFDFSQIEPRVFAVSAEEHGLADQVKAGIDVYTAVAKLVGNRKVAKRIVLGRAYGAGVATMTAQIQAMDKIPITEAEVRAAVEIVDAAFPGFKRYAKSLNDLTEVRLPSGRFAPVDPDRPYKNVNSMVQGTARDLFADAALRIEDIGFGDRVRLYNHDELVLSLPKTDLKGSMDAIGLAMTVPFEWMPVNSEAEIYRGGRWMSETEVVKY